MSPSCLKKMQRPLPCTLLWIYAPSPPGYQTKSQHNLAREVLAFLKEDKDFASCQFWPLYPNLSQIACLARMDLSPLSISPSPVGIMLSFVTSGPCRNFAGKRGFPSQFWCATLGRLLQHVQLLHCPVLVHGSQQQPAAFCSSFAVDCLQWHVSHTAFPGTPGGRFGWVLQDRDPASPTCSAALWLTCHPMSHDCVLLWDLDLGTGAASSLRALSVSALGVVAILYICYSFWVLFVFY